MAILVIRPGIEGEMLCSMLKERNIHSIHFPIIALSSTKNISDSQLNTLVDSDFIIAVSKPAVSFTNTLLQAHGKYWPSTSTYMAVGSKTADRLALACKMSVQFPDHSDSEHLLQLPDLQHVRGKTVTILRGNGGRELIYEELIKRSAVVRYLEVYQRQSIQYDYSFHIEEWNLNAVSSIVVTSEQQLRTFIENIPRKQLPWIQSMKLILPSNRIVTVAKSLGFKNTYNSNSASNSALLASIIRFETGKQHDRQ